jgi:hypothetical protein
MNVIGMAAMCQLKLQYELPPYISSRRISYKYIEIQVDQGRTASYALISHILPVELSEMTRD